MFPVHGSGQAPQLRDITNLGGANNEPTRDFELTKDDVVTLRRIFSSDESADLLEGYFSSPAMTQDTASSVLDLVSDFRFAVPEPFFWY